MHLLFDANISWRICKNLEPYFTTCVHVEKVIANIASDNVIWTYAKANNFIIVTNDEDFLNILNLKGYPPKVLLLKTGNQSNKYLEQLLISKQNEIIELWDTSNYGVLELF